jgi:hypothetical protein
MLIKKYCKKCWNKCAGWSPIQDSNWKAGNVWCLLPMKNKYISTLSKAPRECPYVLEHEVDQNVEQRDM